MSVGIVAPTPHCPSSISTHIVKIPVSSSSLLTPSADFRMRATSLIAFDFKLGVNQTLQRDDACERHFPPFHVCIVKAAANRPTIGWHCMEPHPVNHLHGLGRASDLDG